MPKIKSCTSSNCYMCANGISPELRSEFFQGGWHRRVVPILAFLEKSNGRNWQHLVDDIFDFVVSHWNALWPNGTTEKPSEKTWRETIKAYLQRKKHLFESGRRLYGTRGYWRLSATVDRQMYTSFAGKISTPFNMGNSKESEYSIREAEVVQISPESQFKPIEFPVIEFVPLEMQQSTTEADVSLSKDFNLFLSRNGIRK